MAFMMPVMKNDYDIYKSARSRRASECSSSTSGCRSRKVSECSRSDGPCSLSASPGSGFLGSPAHRSGPLPVSRQYSRTSQSSLQSPSKSTSSSPPKSGSSSSLNKFHTRLVDRLKRSLKCKDSSDGVRYPGRGLNGQCSYRGAYPSRVRPTHVEPIQGKSWYSGGGLSHTCFQSAYSWCGPRSTFCDARRAS